MGAIRPGESGTQLRFLTMPEDRNKIAQALSEEELSGFLDALAALPAEERKLRHIQAKAEEMGIVLSLESARTFRNTTFARHLERIRRRREKARGIAQAVGDGTGRAINEATLGLMAEQIFDELNADADATGDDEEPARLDLEKLDTLTKAASRIQKGFGEVDRVKALLAESQAKLAEYAARERDRAEKSAAARADLAKLRDPKSALTDEDRAAIVHKVDQVLGLA